MTTKLANIHTILYGLGGIGIVKEELFFRKSCEIAGSQYQPSPYFWFWN